MKKIKTIFAILFIVSLTISCSNDDDSSTPTTEGYFFKAKINGNAFSATVPEFGASKSGNIITIACVQGIHKFQLKITNPIDNGVGTYSIPSTTANTINLTYENDVVVYQSGICGSTGTLNKEQNFLFTTTIFLCSSSNKTPDCRFSIKEFNLFSESIIC